MEGEGEAIRGGAEFPEEASALKAAFHTLKRRFEEVKLVVPESLRGVPGPTELKEMILAHAALEEKPPQENSVIQLLGA